MSQRACNGRSEINDTTPMLTLDPYLKKPSFLKNYNFIHLYFLYIVIELIKTDSVKFRVYFDHIYPALSLVSFIIPIQLFFYDHDIHIYACVVLCIYIKSRIYVIIKRTS